jgi:hypothetical protein
VYSAFITMRFDLAGLKNTNPMAMGVDCDAPIIGCPGKIPRDAYGIMDAQPELSGKGLATGVALIQFDRVHLGVLSATV